MSPTVLKIKGYRFFFFSREEERMHVHIICSDGEAKFWLIPEIELAKNYNLSQGQVKEIKNIIETYHDKIKEAWNKHLTG